MKSLFPQIKAGAFTPYQNVCFSGYCSPAGFWKRWFDLTTPSATMKAIKEFNGPVASINSPTDWNVAPEDYLPLIRILKELGHQSEVIENLTHFMATSSFLSTKTEKVVLKSIFDFLQN